jgi:hypothetical protein
VPLKNRINAACRATGLKIGVFWQQSVEEKLEQLEKRGMRIPPTLEKAK